MIKALLFLVCIDASQCLDGDRKTSPIYLPPGANCEEQAGIMAGGWPGYKLERVECTTPAPPSLPSGVQ